MNRTINIDNIETVWEERGGYINYNRLGNIIVKRSSNEVEEFIQDGEGFLRDLNIDTKEELMIFLDSAY